MLTENRCGSCKFYKKHYSLAEKGVEYTGGTCLITGKHTKCVIANDVITFDLQEQCPLNKLNDYEKLQICWLKLRNFVFKLEKESKALTFECERLLKDIIYKIKELEKGE